MTDIRFEDGTWMVDGSVGFARVSHTTFFRVGGYSWVIAETDILTDEFDFESDTIADGVNAAIFALLGPGEVNVNLPIPMYFIGEAKVNSFGIGSAVTSAISDSVDAISSAISLAAGWVTHSTGGSSGGGGLGHSSGGGSDSSLPGGTPEASDPSVPLPPDTTAPTGGEVWVDPNTARTNIQCDANHTGHGTHAPLILDLDGDGVEVNASAQVSFGWDGDGF